jgi:hypothetical protein
VRPLGPQRWEKHMAASSHYVWPPIDYCNGISLQINIRVKGM